MPKNLISFFSFVNDQFAYGGKKYAHDDQKESTDCLFDDFGDNWLFGTIAKYCKRYVNVKRERDLLKIACYMFILWLKRGFHIHDTGTDEIINTTVDIKSKHFPLFKDKVNYFYTCYKFVGDPLEAIYNKLVSFANMSFLQITESDLFEIFMLSYMIWDKDIENKGTDLDTWNENKKQ